MKRTSYCFCQNGVNFYGCLALRGKLGDSSRLDVGENERVPLMLPSFFLPCRAKDLSASRYSA